MGDVRRAVEGYQPGQAVIFGGFDFNGSSDPTTTYGSGFTVAHTATGVWTVTLTVPVHSIVSIALTQAMDTDNVVVRQLIVGDRSNANKTFDVVHLTTADTSTTNVAKADISAAANQSCFFTVVVSRSGQPGST